MAVVEALQAVTHTRENHDFHESFGHVHVHISAETRVAEFVIDPPHRPNFSRPLLTSLQRAQRYMAEHYHRPWFEPYRFDLLVWRATHPEAFNLGGDLQFFLRCLETNDAEAMRSYGRQCVDVVYTNYASMGLPVLTVADIHADCLGGGFEAAMSCDVILAHPRARFGFPETLFNLFPGMGATAFLSRRVSAQVAKQMVLDGKVLAPDASLEAGLVDKVLSFGEGETLRAERDSNRAVKQLQRRVISERYARHALKKSYAISRAELIETVDDWAEAAMQLPPEDIRRMKRFATAQARLEKSAVH